MPKAERAARRVRYHVAASLDGYIAGPDGEYDWIVHDPDVDVYLGAVFAQFDTFLVGRGTFEMMLGVGQRSVSGGGKTIVFSRTLRQEDYPEVTMVSDDIEGAIAALRAAPGKDIWLFGGGLLFRSLLNAGLVDRVEVAVIPVLLGGGIPLLAAPARRTSLKLTGQRVYEKSGIVMLEYDVVRGGAKETKSAPKQKTARKKSATKKPAKEATSKRARRPSR